MYLFCSTNLRLDLGLDRLKQLYHRPNVSPEDFLLFFPSLYHPKRKFVLCIWPIRGLMYRQILAHISRVVCFHTCQWPVWSAHLVMTSGPATVPHCHEFVYWCEELHVLGRLVAPQVVQIAVGVQFLGQNAALDTKTTRLFSQSHQNALILFNI